MTNDTSNVDHMKTKNLGDKSPSLREEGGSAKPIAPGVAQPVAPFAQWWTAIVAPLAAYLAAIRRRIPFTVTVIWPKKTELSYREWIFALRLVQSKAKTKLFYFSWASALLLPIVAYAFGLWWFSK